MTMSNRGAGQRPNADDAPAAPHFVFSSHDGFGLGHVRRNSLIARAILDADPSASVTLVTGVRVKPSWLDHPRLDVVQVPALLKASDGSYRHDRLSFEEARWVRAAIFEETVARVQPSVVVVDRHPFGVGGELRRGLQRARAAGAGIVLGLRDVLDEPTVVRAEMDGSGWDDAGEVFDEALVYGERVLCDHQQEYGLALPSHYCGWVTETPSSVRRDERLVAVTAGGGGDSADVFRLGVALLTLLPDRRGVIVAGPYADAMPDVVGLDRSVRERIELRAEVPGCGELFAAAGSVVQMAGYNSTFESLAAGIRPILVPRRSPRREQAIRAVRLAALGLADVVDEGAPPDEVAWLLRRPRALWPGQLDEAGVHLNGATRAAERLIARARELVS